MGVAQAPGRFGGEPEYGQAPRTSLSERVYAGLLRAYPARFRARYEDEMVQLFADQLRDARAASGTGGLATTWFRSFFDLLSSAVGEHLRRDRDMAQSLATFEPTRSMRLLGLFGAIGAVLLLWAFISFNPFAEIALNRVRLVMFALAYVAISLAFYRRQALAAPTLALLTTAFVVIAGSWYAAWVVLASGVESPFLGTFGLINLFAGIALWVSPVPWAIGLLHTGAAWQGMSVTRGRVTKLGLGLLICSVVGWFGDDRLGLVDTLWGEMWQAIAISGVFLNGLGWLLLSLVLLVGDRRPRRS
jgi:hypothetical protein